MPALPGAGDLRERIAFDKRAIVSDGHGNEEGLFEEQFVVAARVMALRGTERVVAARLEGQQPVVLTVRYSSYTLLIGADWQARNVRSGAVYAITSPASDPDGRKAFLDLLATTGAAA